MNRIVTSDLHLTDQWRDADRWNLFPWLREQVKKYSVKELSILGDLTDAKDRHPSKLVNHFVSEIYELSRLCEIVILKANHDYVDPDWPFFEFTKRIRNIHYITKPTKSSDALYLPHSRNFQADYTKVLQDLQFFTQLIFCHQTFDGAIAENGVQLEGVPPSVFKNFQGQVYSGDIHVPQKIGKKIEHVGAPYRVRFGDTYKPRVLLLKGLEPKDLHFPAKGRELLVGGNLGDLEKADFVMGTQVKIRMRLRRKDFPDWPELKKQVKALVEKRGWELCGLELIARPTKQPAKELPLPKVSPDQTAEGELRKYAKTKRLDHKMTQLGLEFLQEARK